MIVYLAANIREGLSGPTNDFLNFVIDWNLPIKIGTEGNSDTLEVSVQGRLEFPA